MKKRTPKKLVLNRETLVLLENNDLKEAAGGITLHCQYSGYRTCGTCDNATCGTNLC